MKINEFLHGYHIKPIMNKSITMKCPKVSITCECKCVMMKCEHKITTTCYDKTQIWLYEIIKNVNLENKETER